jgi:hypothetical protein
VIASGSLTGGASHYSEIRPVEISTAADTMATCCSLRVFSFLGAAAAQGLTVTAWQWAGQPIRPDSQARLKSYLRTARLETMALPWHGQGAGTFHRYALAGFCEHLALDFSAPSAVPAPGAALAALDAVALELMTEAQRDHVSLGVENCFGCQIVGGDFAFFLRLPDATSLRLPAGTTAADVFTLAKILSA